MVITAERDTVEVAVDILQELGGRVTWLVVKNALYGRRCDCYDASQVRRRLCKNGAVEIDVPRLFQATEEELKAKTLPFGAALSGSELPLTPRHRLFVWRRQTFAALSSAKEVLCTIPT